MTGQAVECILIGAAGSARSLSAILQDKRKEIAFFDAHAASGEYDVFTPQANARLVAAFVRLSGLQRGVRDLDLGCGSGAFTELLRQAGYSRAISIVEVRPKRAIWPG